MEGTLTSGAKFAKGTGSVSDSTKGFKYSGTSTTTGFYYCVIELDFTPKTINLYYKTGSYEGITIYNSQGLGTSTFAAKNVKMSKYSGTSYSSGTCYNFATNTVDMGNNTYHLPIASDATDIRWEAYRG